MIDSKLVRALATTAALTAGVVLSGCNGDTLSPTAKATKPIPEKLLSEIESKNMDKSSPILVRLFKQEAELEIWKQDRTGRFALLKTYPICRWSGDLGPKIREGDRQAPEGFYSISPAQMNPQSQYYLSFNTGFPNAYDKAWGRTGSELMVHGDCSSRGCYAMTDEQISEIYALGRESFFGGQTAFQLQAYPFRMTPQNMAKFRDNPNMPFWKMIKEGNDHFEVTRQEPKVDFCEKRYVFDAAKPDNASRPLTFNASAKCPDYQVPADVAEAVRDKQREDELKTAQLVTRGVPVAKSRAGIDGGMHPIFASKLPEGQKADIDTDGVPYSVASYLPAPGTIPAYVNPPRAPETAVAATTASTTTATASTTTATTSSSSSSSGESFLSRLSRSVGLRGNDTAETTPASQPASKTAATAKTKAEPAKPSKDAAKDAKAVAAKSEVQKSSTAGSEKASAPRVVPLDRTQQATAKDTPAPAPSASSPQQAIAGAQPTVPANSFDSRWSSFR